MSRICTDLQSRLDDDAQFLVERMMISHWVISLSRYCAWWNSASIDYSLPVEAFLDPPVACFNPERKDQLTKFDKYGLMFKCYDLIRQKAPPISIGCRVEPGRFHVVQTRK